MPPGVSYHDLESLLAQRGAALLTDVLERLPECHEHRRAQDDALATRAPKLNAKVSHVRWDQWPAAAIVARHRAFAYMVSAKWHFSVLTKKVSTLDDACAINVERKSVAVLANKRTAPGRCTHASRW